MRSPKDHDAPAPKGWRVLAASGALRPVTPGFPAGGAPGHEPEAPASAGEPAPEAAAPLTFRKRGLDRTILLPVLRISVVSVIGATGWLLLQRFYRGALDKLLISHLCMACGVVIAIFLALTILSTLISRQQAASALGPALSRGLAADRLRVWLWSGLAGGVGASFVIAAIAASHVYLALLPAQLVILYSCLEMAATTLKKATRLSDPQQRIGLLLEGGLEQLARISRNPESASRSALQEIFRELSASAGSSADVHNYSMMHTALAAFSELLGTYLLAKPRQGADAAGGKEDRLLQEELAELVRLFRRVSWKRDHHGVQEVIAAIRDVGVQAIEASQPQAAVLVCDVTGAAAREALDQRFEEGVLAGLSALRELMQSAASRQNTLVVLSGAHKIHTLGLLAAEAGQQLAAASAMQAMMEALESAVAAGGLVGSNTIASMLDYAARILQHELARESGETSHEVAAQQLMAPFFGLAHSTSIGRIYEAVAARLYAATQEQDWPRASDLRHVLREIDEWVLATLVEIAGSAAVRQSPALGTLNSAMSQLLNTQLILWSEMDLLEMSGETSDLRRERYLRDEFCRELLESVAEILQQVYGRALHAFPERITVRHFWDLPRTLSQVGIRAVQVGAVDAAIAATGVISQLAIVAAHRTVQEEPHAPALVAEHIARVGIIALQYESSRIVQASLHALKQAQGAYAHKLASIPECSSERRRELLARLPLQIRELRRGYYQSHLLTSLEESAFFSSVRPETVSDFLLLVHSHLGAELLGVEPEAPAAAAQAAG